MILSPRPPSIKSDELSFSTTCSACETTAVGNASGKEARRLVQEPRAADVSHSRAIVSFRTFDTISCWV